MRGIVRRGGVAGMVASLVLVTSAVPAFAQPVAGCGAGFQNRYSNNQLGLLSLGAAGAALLAQNPGNPVLTPGVVAGIIADTDANDDGYVCMKDFSPNQGQDKYWNGLYGTAYTDYVVMLILDNKAVGQG